MSGKASGGDGQRGQTDGQIDRLVSDRYLDEMPTLWLLTVGWDKGSRKCVIKYFFAVTQPKKNICTVRSSDVWYM